MVIGRCNGIQCPCEGRGQVLVNLNLQAKICCSNATALRTAVGEISNILAVRVTSPPSAFNVSAMAIVGTPESLRTGWPKLLPGSRTTAFDLRIGYQRVASSSTFSSRPSRRDGPITLGMTSWRLTTSTSASSPLSFSILMKMRLPSVLNEVLVNGYSRPSRSRSSSTVRRIRVRGTPADTNRRTNRSSMRSRKPIPSISVSASCDCHSGSYLCLIPWRLLE